VKAFLRFWYDFIVGDDWTIAVGVVLALGATAVLAHQGLTWVWWLLPVVVALGLTWSVLRGAKPTKPLQP
jgi:amino acid transporter